MINVDKEAKYWKHILHRFVVEVCLLELKDSHVEKKKNNLAVYISEICHDLKTIGKIWSIFGWTPC